MNSIASFLLSLTAIIVSIGCGVLSMIYGWGLTPKSWWWIIGFNLIGMFIGQFMLEVAKRITH
jgi:RsiW-degrading membrane proteinase PrsW (M82 family)